MNIRVPFVLTINRIDRLMVKQIKRVMCVNKEAKIYKKWTV